MSLAMRNEVPVELTWDLSLIYPTEEAMYRDVEKMKALCASMEERFKGKLTTPEAICDCLNDLQEMTRLMTLTDRKSTRLNSSHPLSSRMPSSA